ncbi:hypothetical protein [Haliangium sp.]|uniref:hypothetical protein n=1 Tax=Haliangium sp. TaxID=2663208 RepID=UPI003D143652
MHYRVTDCLQSWGFAGLSVLVLVTTAWLSYAGQVLVTAQAPHGIVSYELARSVDGARAILASWPPPARAAALLIQGVDYLYLVLYPAWFALAAERLGGRLGGSWRRVGVIVSWAALAAAPLDAVENYALIHQLMDAPSATHASLAWWCAVPKFALVGLAAAFLVFGGGEWLRRALGARSRPAR